MNDLTRRTRQLISLVKEQGGKKSALIILRKIALRAVKLSLDLSLSYHFKRMTSGFVTVNVNGYKMFLDLRNDPGMSKFLFLFRKNEFMVTDLLQTRGVIQKGDTVLELGGNMGYYALLESGLVGSEGMVYVFEPVARNFALLEKNIGLNDIRNIKTFKLAAGNDNGEEIIHAARAGNLSSLVVRTDVEQTANEKVQVVRVDDFVSEQGIVPQFIMMDIEGYEGEAIEGMRKTLSSSNPKILIEIHLFIMGNEKVERMLSTIEACGYRNSTVIYEKNRLRVRRDGTPNPLFRFFARNIEGAEGAQEVGAVETMDLRELRVCLKEALKKRELPSGKSCVHVLFS